MSFKQEISMIMSLPQNYHHLSNEELTDADIYDQLYNDIDFIDQFLEMHEKVLVQLAPKTFKKICKVRFLLRDTLLRIQFNS